MGDAKDEHTPDVHLWMEGRTLVELQADQARPTHMPRGPAKRTGPGFLNPAMAPARTRSVLLLADALEHGWLVKPGDDLRALDVMCATGVRVRRWRHEVPRQHQHRLRIAVNDLDTFALSWLERTHRRFSPPVQVKHAPEDDRYERPPNGRMVDGLFLMQQDARVALMEASYQWVDIDPFGSPVPFLDSAMQGLSRTAFLEVTATDTAALTGSSPSAQQRRYGARGIVDDWAHDDAVRVLLGLVATTAARHDRAIEPVLALFDGHHVRVSVLVRRSKERASEVLQSMGWRVRDPDGPDRFVQHPSETELARASGPMWTGPLWNESITARMTEARALELCAPTPRDIESARAHGLKWTDHDTEHARRETVRSVRCIAEASAVMSGPHRLHHVDALPNRAGTAHGPKLEALIQALRDQGHLAARVPDLDPFLATNAPYETVMQTVRELVGAPLEDAQPNDGSTS